jgi:Carboxypeptidase regulatory-like domain
MKMQRRRIFLLVVVVVLIVAGLILLREKRTGDTTFTTTVSVESGTVDVQSPEGTARLKAGETAVVGKKKVLTEKLKALEAEIEKLIAIKSNLFEEIAALKDALAQQRLANEQLTSDLQKPEETVSETGVHGYVYDLLGNPAGGVAMSISGFLAKQNTFTDKDGYYKTTELPEANYTVICEFYPDEKPRVMVYSGRMTTLDFKSPDKVDLYGYLFDENGEPFSTDISITDSMRRTYRVRSNEDGYYEFKNVPRDTYSVLVNWGARFENDTADPIEIPEDVTGHQHDIVLSAATISGKLIYKNTGEPVSGAYIRARSQTGTASTHSDDEGFYLFGNPGGGEYTISFNQSACIYKTITVTVPEDEDFTINDIELVALPQSWFILSDQNGEPVNRLVSVLYRNAQGSAGMDIQPFQNGLFQREGMQPGEYKIKITAEGYEDFEKEITIPGDGFPRTTPYEIIMKKQIKAVDSGNAK